MDPATPDCGCPPAASVAVFRFHGRCTETSEPTPVVERFRYLYSADELGEQVPRIRQAAGSVKNLHLLMNNRHADYGTARAREIAAMLAESS
jgi:uncharacterized protein YecE (DUF72 family)